MAACSRVTTGTRKNEVLGLRWKDLDLGNGTLQLRTALERSGGVVSFAKPKTKGSQRRIQLTTMAAGVGPQHAQLRFSYVCAGSMLTLSRKTLSGSYLRFTSASRA